MTVIKFVGSIQDHSIACDVYIDDRCVSYAPLSLTLDEWHFLRGLEDGLLSAQTRTEFAEDTGLVKL